MTFQGGENFWLYVPLILWIGGIFYLSSNKGSISNTSRFLSPIFAFLFPDKEADKLKTYHLYFRKLCHFFGYGILAVWAILAYYNSTLMFLANYWYLSAFLTVVFVASADEIKQSLYANRVGSVSDVVLDSIGGLTAILLFQLFQYFF
ncbi:MAG: VanZ family protein [Blastocatellia bacterium]|nr:VanZ family protein [Blastocatellia bacterium]